MLDFPITDTDAVFTAFQKARVFYNQKELAQLLRYTPRQISRWESGEGPIPYALLPAIEQLIERTNARKETGSFTFIDLFAGIGGIRLGFESAGGQCVFTSEWDLYAQKTYHANFIQYLPKKSR